MRKRKQSDSHASLVTLLQAQHPEIDL